MNADIESMKNDEENFLNLSLKLEAIEEVIQKINDEHFWWKFLELFLSHAGLGYYRVGGLP